jgi:hypothetical protein
VIKLDIHKLHGECSQDPGFEGPQLAVRILIISGLEGGNGEDPKWIPYGNCRSISELVVKCGRLKWKGVLLKSLPFLNLQKPDLRAYPRKTRSPIRNKPLNICREK